jgi:hypothetical protein
MTPVPANEKQLLKTVSAVTTQTNKQWIVTRKPPEKVQDIRTLKQQLDLTRE